MITNTTYIVICDDANRFTSQIELWWISSKWNGKEKKKMSPSFSAETQRPRLLPKVIWSEIPLQSSSLSLSLFISLFLYLTHPLSLSLSLTLSFFLFLSLLFLLAFLFYPIISPSSLFLLFRMKKQKEKNNLLESK